MTKLDYKIFFIASYGSSLLTTLNPRDPTVPTIKPLEYRHHVGAIIHQSDTNKNQNKASPKYLSDLPRRPPRQTDRSQDVQKRGKDHHHSLSKNSKPAKKQTRPETRCCRAVPRREYNAHRSMPGFTLGRRGHGGHPQGWETCR